ncbi:Alkylated DNA repair protein alkB 8 [Chytriomyces hyalinus]|nr:Alkylated DNA repair protein alkB 8 [Chytriomyces hyalinus]
MHSDQTVVDYEALERTHVQSVYQAIAPHFSATRYKPWPVVEDFLGAIPDGSIGADVGCGNGKYLGVNPKLLTIGSDMSSNLVGICAQRGFEAMVCDNLHLPYRTNCFDFVISIAVIHHFSSFERRVAAVKELVRTIRPGGKILIFVWALEQEDGSKRKFEKQDVFVPWNLDAKTFAGKSKAAGRSAGMRKGKKGQGPDGKDSAVVEEKADIIKEVSTPTTPASSTEEANPNVAKTIEALSLESNPDDAAPKVVVKSGNENIVYQRYYHVFVKGELDQVVEAAGGLEVDKSGYDRDNWYIIATKK